MKGVDLSSYGSVPLNQVWPGRVVYAHVPYRDDPGSSKTRPAVVVDRVGRTIWVCPMYSRPGERRIEIYRHGRRCYIDLCATKIDRYNLVNLDPEDVTDEVWDYMADGRVIFPEEPDET